MRSPFSFGSVVFLSDACDNNTSSQLDNESMTGDEVTLLDMAFGSLQEKLAIYSREVEEFNRTLEQQVADKTRELEAFNASLEEVLKAGTIVGLEKHTVLRSKDGKERSIADSGAPIRNKDEKIVGAVLVFRDVTEKTKMEEELFKARKLESVGVLAGGIAHDFNNILVAILGNISLACLAMLQEGLDDSLLEEAEKASLRARDLTQQLLTFSKGGEPVRRLASISEIITDNADFVLRGSKVRCEYSFAKNLWPLEIDAGQISQVIQNIVINANQAMPLGGVLSIRCRNVSRGQNAECTVSIPGAGEGCWGAGVTCFMLSGDDTDSADKFYS